MKGFGLFFVIIFFSIFFSGCSGWERRPFYEADISGIHIDSIEIRQYEEVLFNLNPFILRQEIDPYLGKFSFFLGDRIDDEDGQRQLYDYVTDPFMIDLYLDSRQVWPDVQDLSSSLTDAFRYYTYHFPEHSIPYVYTYISGIDYHMPVLYSEGHMVIALDTYLGHDYPLYGKLGIPAYQSRWMVPGRAPVDVMRMMARKHMAQVSPAPETLLEHMVYEGKKLFFLDCMMPHVHDSLKIKYTGRQLDWMTQNAGFAWTYKIDNDLLYSTDHAVITKFVREAPFTSPFSRNSAPRTGAWLGWQIVREYMKRNEETGLEELLFETNARTILTQSRYRPR